MEDLNIKKEWLVVLTHWLHRPDQHVSLYFAVTLIHCKPAINWELVHFFIPHVINHHLERRVVHDHAFSCTTAKIVFVCRTVHTLSRNHPAEEPLLLCPMVIFLSLPRFGASIVNLSSDPRSKLSLSLSSRLSPFVRNKESQNRDQSH